MDPHSTDTEASTYPSRPQVYAAEQPSGDLKTMSNFGEFFSASFFACLASTPRSSVADSVKGASSSGNGDEGRRGQSGAAGT